MHPGKGDILVTWNRIREGQHAAIKFESLGLPVIVTENASWGNDFFGHSWLYLGLNYHNKGSGIVFGGSHRWDSLGVTLPPFRTSGETVILPQRGIGPEGIAMPRNWAYHAQRVHGGRIRPHPGNGKCIPLELDLARCGLAVTWGSGAAIKALMQGIPVRSDMLDWAGAQDNTIDGRLAMFRRLAWANWHMHEISSGEAFKALLNG